MLTVFVAAIVAGLGGLVAGLVWKATPAAVGALVEIARLPAAVDALRDAVDVLANVPRRLDRLEAVVFPPHPFTPQENPAC